MIKRNTLLFLSVMAAGLGLPSRSLSQILLPPDQPEQDACHALGLCGGKFFAQYSYQGFGKVDDLTSTPCGAGETNSFWMKISVAAAGTLAFKIIPVDTADDYDFAVLNVTNVNCDHLSSSNVVRCNTNVNTLGSNPGGIVGLSDSATEDFVPDGFFGDSYVKSIDVQPGQTYLIMVSNFGHDDFSGPSSGFTLDFTTSTATFVNNVPPSLIGALKMCSYDSVIVQLSKPVQCSTIAPDGSNFNIPGVAVASAGGLSCINGEGYDSLIVIRFAAPVAPGDYTVNVQYGTNSLSLLDACNDPIPLPNSASFMVPPPVKTDYLLPSDTTKCDYSTIPLKSNRAFDGYLWSTGATTPAIAVNDPGTYTLQVTDNNGCVGKESVTITDSFCPQYVYLPSAFTPNNDGHNDIFRPKFAGATSSYRFAVYDRMGEKVFETGVPGAGWDGTTGGRPQPAGIYVWVCIYQLYKERQQMQRGTVMLVR